MLFIITVRASTRLRQENHKGCKILGCPPLGHDMQGWHLHDPEIRHPLNMSGLLTHPSLP